MTVYDFTVTDSDGKKFLCVPMRDKAWRHLPFPAALEAGVKGLLRVAGGE